MPTILLVDGLRVVIYPNDHRPEHVHVIGNGCEAVFNLNCTEGPPTLRENYGFTKRRLEKIAEELADNLALLCSKWSEIHGNH